MTYRIVSDSSSNIFNLNSEISYTTVPLKILVDGVEYTDEPGLDTEALVAKMEASQWGSSTSCPSPQEWMNAFDGADYILRYQIAASVFLFSDNRSPQFLDQSLRQSIPYILQFLFQDQALCRLGI